MFPWLFMGPHPEQTMIKEAAYRILGFDTLWRSAYHSNGGLWRSECNTDHLSSADPLPYSGAETLEPCYVCITGGNLFPLFTRFSFLLVDLIIVCRRFVRSAACFALSIHIQAFTHSRSASDRIGLIPKGPLRFYFKVCC